MEDENEDLENYMLVCGNIQEIQSVFVSNNANETDSEDERTDAEKRRQRGDNIPQKYLVPLSLFLENSIF